MALNPTLTLLSGNKVRLEWTPDLTGQGYRLYVDGVAVSRTFKPDAKSTTFAIPDDAPHRYGVQKMDVVDALEEVAYPTPTPPPAGDKLRHRPPTLTDPLVFELTNANRNSSFLSNGNGRDMRILQKEVLTGPMASPQYWGDIVWIGGEFASTSAGSSMHVSPRNRNGIVFLEGIKYRSAVQNDFLCPRCDTNGGDVEGIIMQNCDIQITDAGTTFHADIYQTQAARVKFLKIDRCTFSTDYQGIFVQNEPGYTPPTFHGPVEISRTNFKPGLKGRPATYVYKALYGDDAFRNNLGLWTLDDVWMPDDAPGNTVVPDITFRNWLKYPEYHRFGCFIESDARGRYVRFSTADDLVANGTYKGQPAYDSGIRGVIRLGTPPDFAKGAGMSYVSPGYL